MGLVRVQEVEVHTVRVRTRLGWGWVGLGHEVWVKGVRGRSCPS